MGSGSIHFPANDIILFLMAVHMCGVFLMHLPIDGQRSCNEYCGNKQGSAGTSAIWCLCLSSRSSTGGSCASSSFSCLRILHASFHSGNYILASICFLCLNPISFFLCAWKCLYAHAMVPMWRSEANAWAIVSSYRVGPHDGTQVIRLSGKCLKQPSHLPPQLI